MMSKIISRRFQTFQPLLIEKPLNLKNKKHSSQQWIVRQLKDPYVEKARQYNYRCRSAFKLLEIDKKYQLFRPGITVVDCGAAPGSWTQVAVKCTNADGHLIDKPMGTVIAIDRLPIHYIPGATIFGNLDFTAQETQEILNKALNGKLVDVVMSDMAPNASGSKALDHENIVKLAYMALKFSIQVSKCNAAFVVKLWDGSIALELERNIGKYYEKVKILKPHASRDESSEKFIVARGFKGIKV